MPRDERHTETIPYGTLGIIPLASCTQMGKKVDEYLVKWREQRQNENTSTLNFAGYKRDSYIVNAKTPRFGSGEGKGVLVDSVRGHDLYIMLDVCNFRYCDVFRRLGFDFPDPRPAEKRPRPNPMGEKQGIWIGFAPFSAQPGKTYPEKLSAEAVRLLSGRFDRVFVHSGGGEEAEFARRMEALYPNVTALYGKIKLGDEMNLISNLDCVVSMDSLVMHLASLMATPTVSVWGATHPGLGFLGYGFEQEGVLQTDFACRPCSVYGKKPCKYGDYRCIWSIEPQMILDRVERLVGKTE